MQSILVMFLVLIMSCSIMVQGFHPSDQTLTPRERGEIMRSMGAGGSNRSVGSVVGPGDSTPLRYSSCNADRKLEIRSEITKIYRCTATNQFSSLCSIKKFSENHYGYHPASPADLEFAKSGKLITSAQMADYFKSGHKITILLPLEQRCKKCRGLRNITVNRKRVPCPTCKGVGLLTITQPFLVSL